MKKMGPDEFVEMLRSAIKQDEWLLFLHGGALGLFAASSTWRSLECEMNESDDQDVNLVRAVPGIAGWS